MAVHRTKRKKKVPDESADDGMTLEALSKDLDTYSSTISTQVRTIALGVLGLSWVMLLGEQNVAAVAAKLSRPWVLAISGTCLVALLLDLIQYLLDYRTTSTAYERAAQSAKGTAELDDKSFSYHAAFWCYRAKLYLTVGAAIALFVSIGRVLI